MEGIINTAGTYKGVADEFSLSSISSFINKLYHGMRVTGINAYDAYKDDKRYFNISVTVQDYKTDLLGWDSLDGIHYPLNMFEDVDQENMDKFISSVEWEEFPEGHKMNNLKLVD